MPTTFEDKLLTELLTAAEAPAAPAPRVRKVLPIAAAVALLGAGGLTLAGADRASVAAPRTATTRPTITFTDANALLAATTAAMDRYGYARVVMHRDGSVSELWTLPDGYVRRMKYTENGAVQYDMGFPADHDAGTARRVDFVTRTYEEHPQQWYRVLTLTDFRTQLNAGNFVVVGQEGDLTHLRETRPGVNSDVWVDSTTYLPVKTTFSSDVMTDSTEWTWVSKADTQESDFVPPIPDGFTAR